MTAGQPSSSAIAGGDDGPPALRNTVTVVFFMTIVQAIGSMAGLWLPSIAPEVAAGTGVEAAYIGFQVMIVYFGGMTTSLLAGGLIARLGAWRTAQVSLLLFALAHAMIASANLAAMAVGSFVIGLGYGLINPPASHLLAKVVTPRNRNFVFSVRFTGVPLGGIAASIAAPAAALAFGWQASMVVTALAALAFAAAMQPWRAGWDTDRSPGIPLFRSPVADLKTAWRISGIRWLCFTGLFYAAIQLSLTSFTVTLLVKEIGYPLIAAGLALTAVQVAGVTGRLSWGLIADRVGSPFAVLTVIGFITVACSAAVIFLDPTWPKPFVYVLFFVFGFASMGWNGVFASAVAELSPPGRIGNMTGAALFYTFSGVIVGPVVFTNGFKLTGEYTSTFAVTALLALLGVLTVRLARRGTVQ